MTVKPHRSLIFNGRFAEIDRAAKEENHSRSEFLQKIAMFYFEMKKKQIPPGLYPDVQKAVAIQDTLANQDTLSSWDSTAEIRKWREKR